MKLEFLRRIFEKYTIMKFLENLYSGSRVVTCGQAADGWTYVTKLIVALRQENAPKKLALCLLFQRLVVFTRCVMFHST